MGWRSSGLPLAAVQTPPDVHKWSERARLVRETTNIYSIKYISQETNEKKLHSFINNFLKMIKPRFLFYFIFLDKLCPLSNQKSINLITFINIHFILSSYHLFKSSYCTYSSSDSNCSAVSKMIEGKAHK